ncbi:Acyl-coenzyme A:6-aminopenicillanic acid acyl-transferase [Aquisphaera giovannonii]|uniref:Acyl-coenzyme A:6-aminopenicillanic acid acyl-transferase n=1 Tax=Aquisphaera giovannonii TaxID=406548 RepID=A0A5B9WEY5_9BACT|nr:C45 family peptidase [Aquisphaera giovannonii]QEH38511.1 Acyl-coenzyme A:6-aminopenicillanic acid acyl-transferase [Aquisphaera giovannonii]
MLRKSMRIAVLVLIAGSASSPSRAETKTIARCGEGFLEEVNGYRVLHVKGTPYQMGYQQGALLKDDIRENVRFLFEEKGKEMKVELAGLKLLDPKKVIAGIAARQKKLIPERFFEEMRGVADGAGMDVQDIVTANFIPELFHCSGFAISGSATKDGTLYHGRILDYGCDWRLQDHAVLTIAEPEGRIPFVNVTYAGFVGSVTGMNALKVSIGEMGGKGLGHWDGVPMAFLMRMVLEEANTLDQAIAVFRDHPRTCEYYFVIADGKTGQGVGMEASWNAFHVVKMGEGNEKLPAAVKDAVLLSAGDRYKELVRRVQAGHGTFDAESARHLMDRPVAMKSNLHSVLFETTTGRMWVANATKEGQPAAEQPYHAFDFPGLLKHRADPSTPALPAPPSSAPPQASPRRAAQAGTPAAAVR